MTTISDFIARIKDVYKTGIAREHAYRPALHDLLKSLGDYLEPVNDPARSDVGAPDFIVLREGIAIGHLEAKDIDTDIRTMKDANKRQKDRYVNGLPNLVYTNCLDWDFYRDGELIASVTIADLAMGIQPKPDQFSTLENLLKNFIAQHPQTITSPKELAQRMAGKAILIKDVLGNTLRKDENPQTELTAQYYAFKENLIHDITPQDFADIYAETIAYGMFAARLHDTTLGTFSRQEALELLPRTYPFLRSLFTYVAGTDLDHRIAWIIDELARVFRACDVAKLMENFGKLTGKNDPFLHFYETFLAAYNPSKRKALGVWYTPEPVVNFIVRAVDEVLQTEFSVPDGLADTSKITIDWDTGQTDKKGKAVTIKKDVHRVQILDPATGTGTFLAEVIKQIAPKIQGVAPGMWSQYVEDDLIPRLNGFELLMASYAMCHMKLDMILTELDYKPTKTAPRLSVYLTNSLEEGEPVNQQLPFSQWLSREAKGANTIKRDIPIMCVIGNPPYNPSSKNSGPWIIEKMKAYREGVSDKKVNLNDDYMKFIRMAEDLVEGTPRAVVAMITNNSFLDGTTQRGMRRHLLKSFDRIEIFNLHGDIRSQQIDPRDENVFEITQGVSIIVMVKDKSTNREQTVGYTDLTGSRKAKTSRLQSLGHILNYGKRLRPEEPYYFFKPFRFEDVGEAFPLDDFFEVKSSGIQTKNDKVAISWSSAERDRILNDFIEQDIEVLEEKYPSMKVWKASAAKSDIDAGRFEPRTITYRPFDVRHTVLTQTSSGFLGRPRYAVMQHIRENDFSLVVNKKHVGDDFSHVYVGRSLIAHGVNYLGNRGQDFACPLYLGIDGLDEHRRVNFDPKLWAKLQTLATHPIHGAPDEVQAFDYIYGVLHCPAYRENYADYLKIDFPRIPWPATPDEFWDVSAKGTALRKLHLMDPATIGKTSYPFTTAEGAEGDNVVDVPSFSGGKIWINETQYFADAPEVSWAFYIGGYQPAQKWLKDRNGRVLSFDDVKHYQRILKILSETDRIMKTITMRKLPISEDRS